MKDISLENAMIAWTKNEKVEIIEHPMKNDEMRHKGLVCDIGASNSYWREISPIERLAELLRHGYVLALEEGISLEKTHAAYQVIPEYREYMDKSR